MQTLEKDGEDRGRSSTEGSDSDNDTTKSVESCAIQIFARIRPQKGSKSTKYYVEEKSGLPSVGFKVDKDESQGIINNQKENHEFKFSKVFDQDAGQEEVFDTVAKGVCDSVLQGYNGTIFAYGQTGSGKTFTITGGAERYQDRGLIPRSIQYIFKNVRESRNKSFEIRISYLEIYQEAGYDLLDTSRDAKKLEDLAKVTLMEDESKNIHLRNLSVVAAANEEEAINLLFVGDTNKMIAETPSNPTSSRSHCIFIIGLASKAEGSDTVRRSKLHLVDLAGSERVHKTQVGGNLLKEALHINLSLHYLEQGK
ncbi:MAG: hypothetical protein SGCHY_003769 [Lobulomycetales sp.]